MGIEMGTEPQFVKLAEGFYLNLSLIIEINGNEVHYADGSVFTLDDECIKTLTERLGG